MNVGEENIASVARDSHIILQVQRKLKIIAPVTALESVVRKNGIVEENPQPLEIAINAIEHNDVRCDDEEISRERGLRLVQFVEIAPRERQAKDFGLAGACRQ